MVSTLPRVSSVAAIVLSIDIFATIVENVYNILPGIFFTACVYTHP